jgi:hypothetical protein
MITRIFCSRSSAGHEIGSISADAGGLLLSYRAAVLSAPGDPAAVRSPQDGEYYRKTGAPAQLRRDPGALTHIELWCEGCVTGHPVDAGALFDAAVRRRRKITLTSRGAWEGLWS